MKRSENDLFLFYCQQKKLTNQ